MSANLNTLAGTIYEDFILPHFEWAKSDKAASNIMKGLVVINGTVCVILIFLVEKLGSVLQISLSFSGMTAGPILGLFTLGMLFRKANAKVTCGLVFARIRIFVFIGRSLWMFGFSYGYVVDTHRKSAQSN